MLMEFEILIMLHLIYFMYIRICMHINIYRRQIEGECVKASICVDEIIFFFWEEKRNTAAESHHSRAINTG